MINAYSLLFLAIVSEVTATMLLKASDGWERWWFGIASILFYALAAWFLGYALRSLHVGLVYAIWSGVGILMISLASVIIWKQGFDFYAMLGVGFILLGTLLLTLKSTVMTSS